MNRDIFPLEKMGRHRNQIKDIRGNARHDSKTFLHSFYLPSIGERLINVSGALFWGQNSLETVSECFPNVHRDKDVSCNQRRWLLIMLNSVGNTGDGVYFDRHAIEAISGVLFMWFISILAYDTSQAPSTSISFLYWRVFKFKEKSRNDSAI